MDVAGLEVEGFMDVAGLEVAGFQIIEEAAGLEVQAHTEDAMDADTPQTSEHWWLQSRPGRNDSMSLRGSNSETNGRQELLSVSPLEDLMRTIQREHSSAADRDVHFSAAAHDTVVEQPIMLAMKHAAESAALRVHIAIHETAMGDSHLQ